MTNSPANTRGTKPWIVKNVRNFLQKKDFIAKLTQKPLLSTEDNFSTKREESQVNWDCGQVQFFAKHVGKSFKDVSYYMFGMSKQKLNFKKSNEMEIQKWNKN